MPRILTLKIQCDYCSNSADHQVTVINTEGELNGATIFTIKEDLPNNWVKKRYAVKPYELISCPAHGEDEW
jgi:hypothetical protein